MDHSCDVTARRCWLRVPPVPAMWSKWRSPSQNSTCLQGAGFYHAKPRPQYRKWNSWSMDKASILLKYVGIVKCIKVSIQCLSWPVSIQPNKLILTSPFFSCSIFRLIFRVKSTKQRHIPAQQRSRPADNQRFSSCLTLCGELSTLIQPGTKHLQCSHTYAKLTRLKRKDMPSSH